MDLLTRSPKHIALLQTVFTCTGAAGGPQGVCVLDRGTKHEAPRGADPDLSAVSGCDGHSGLLPVACPCAWDFWSGLTGWGFDGSQLSPTLVQSAWGEESVWEFSGR